MGFDPDYYYQQFIQLPEEERQATVAFKRAQAKRQERDKRGRFVKRGAGE